mgnify:CR=1 FL=1
MAITKPNIKAIQEVLLTDMQRRIFKQYNERKDEFNLRDEDYDRTQSALTNSINNLNDMRDVNELMLEYCDLFDSYDDLTVATIDGTMNYVIGLLVKQCELHKQSV